MHPTTDAGGGADRSALLLIEFQREWLDEDGKVRAFMEDRAQFEAAVEHAANLLAAARAGRLPVVHVGYDFAEGHPDLGQVRFGLREMMRRGGMFTGAGAEFAPAFAPGRGEFVVSGRLGVSAFAGSNLDGYLRNNRIERLYLAGFALQTCVESTLRDAHDRGYEAVIVEDACAAFSPEQRAYVLDRVVPVFGERITSETLARTLGVRTRVPASA